MRGAVGTSAMFLIPCSLREGKALVALTGEGREGLGYGTSHRVRNCCLLPALGTRPGTGAGRRHKSQSAEGWSHGAVPVQGPVTHSAVDYCERFITEQKLYGQCLVICYLSFVAIFLLFCNKYFVKPTLMSCANTGVRGSCSTVGRERGRWGFLWINTLQRGKTGLTVFPLWSFGRALSSHPQHLAEPSGKCTRTSLASVKGSSVWLQELGSDHGKNLPRNCSPGTEYQQLKMPQLVSLALCWQSSSSISLGN